MTSIPKRLPLGQGPPMTKAVAMRAIKQRWGETCRLEEYRKAPSAEERERMETRRGQIGGEIAAVEAAMNLIPGDTRANLIAAARFALDVDGDEPAWSQLRAAVEAEERLQELGETRRALRDERDMHHCARKRFTVLNDKSCYSVILASADTLDELLA